MLRFKLKKLNRNDFIKLVDNNKIWSKTMTLTEIKELLEYLEKEIPKYKYDYDKKFIMNLRRKELKSKIEKILAQNYGNINERVTESLFIFWEFVGDEYPGNIISNCRELGLSVKEYEAMDNSYRKKGIICIQEKEVILEIMQAIKNYINENLKNDNIK